MQTTIKIFILSVLALFISSCAVSNPSYDNKNVNLYAKGEKILITSMPKTFNPAYCADFAYTVYDPNTAYGKIFIESISLSQNCNWNGYARGFLQKSMKKYLKISSFDVVEKLDIEGYEFTTFRVDDGPYISLIYKFLGSDEKLIIDYDGKLSEKLIKKFNPDYTSKYLNEERYSKKYDHSLVRDNFFEAYFSREREIFMN